MTEATYPRILSIVQQAIDTETLGQLSKLQAVVAKLWLYDHRDDVDPDGNLRKAIEAYWRAQSGRDPYWDFLDNRSVCDKCHEGYKYENLSICPNCFQTFCYRDRANGCNCPFSAVG